MTDGDNTSNRQGRQVAEKKTVIQNLPKNPHDNHEEEKGNKKKIEPIPSKDSFLY